MADEMTGADVQNAAGTQNVKRGWFVLRAISGKEAKVKEILDAAIRNTDLGRYVFQVLIPTEPVYQTRNGKKVLKQRTLYSGYVFVECRLVKTETRGKEGSTTVFYKLPGEVQYELRNTTNVIDFLRGRAKNSEPEMLREKEVMRMLGAADNLMEMQETDGENFMPGEHVKVTFGAFNGFRGEVREVNQDRKKLKVEIKIFDRMVDLELENSQVERE